MVSDSDSSKTCSMQSMSDDEILGEVSILIRYGKHCKKTMIRKSASKEAVEERCIQVSFNFNSVWYDIGSLHAWPLVCRPNPSGHHDMGYLIPSVMCVSHLLRFILLNSSMMHGGGSLGGGYPQQTEHFQKKTLIHEYATSS